jgi:hypothetical protein
MFTMSELRWWSLPVDGEDGPVAEAEVARLRAALADPTGAAA